MNQEIAAVIKAGLMVADRPEAADLQIHSFDWSAPEAPRRLFIDHGSFADASFWARIAPALRASDAILVSSRVCEQVAARCIASSGPKIVRVPFGVDTELFRPAVSREQNRRSLRDDYGIPERGPLLLCVSAFTRRKNQHLAIHFFRPLLERHPDAVLVLVGSTPERPSNRRFRASVEALTQEEGVAGRVRILEPLGRDRLARLMGAADLLLHLSTARLENFGLVIAEALASGLPVVASDWGGFRDLVVHRETGLLAPTWLSARGPRVDWQAPLGDAAAILEDRGAWSSMSRKARAWAEENLSPAGFRGRILAAVQGLAGDREPLDGPVRLTPAAEELRFRTLHLRATHPGISGMSEEHRLLIRLDGGRHYRFLTGPAATRETPPAVGWSDVLYAGLRFVAVEGCVRILDPVWPDDLELGRMETVLLSLVDGKTSLERIAADRRLTRADGAGPTDKAVVLAAAQRLVDEGLLCPLSALSPGRPVGESG